MWKWESQAKVIKNWFSHRGVTVLYLFNVTHQVKQALHLFSSVEKKTFVCYSVTAAFGQLT